MGKSLNTGFYIYLLFIISWFLHLTARIEVLGLIHFDLILVALLIILAIFNYQKWKQEAKNSKIYNILNILIVYIFVTTPFVEWPGSVLRFGLENFIKAIMFYYFTIFFIDSREKLEKAYLKLLRIEP